MANDPSVDKCFTHIWKSKTTHPERNGQPCRVIAGSRYSLLVQFTDGTKLEVKVQCIRKRAQPMLRPSTPH